MSDKISDDDLEALVDYFAPPNNSSTGKDVHIALRELQSRRAQDKGGEPVAWRHKTPHGYVVTKTMVTSDSEPLYAATPASEGKPTSAP